MSELTERYKLMESALEFMLMAYDSDEDYRRHCGVGNDVSFPGYKGPVQSVSEVRRILKRDGEGNQK